VRSSALVADLPLVAAKTVLGFHIADVPIRHRDAAFRRMSISPAQVISRTMEFSCAPAANSRQTIPQTSPGVAVVNGTAAQRFWPGEDPLGKQITFDDTRMLTIVGVIGDVRQRSLGVTPQPEIFLDYCSRARIGHGWFW